MHRQTGSHTLLSIISDFHSYIAQQQKSFFQVIELTFKAWHTLCLHFLCLCFDDGELHATPSAISILFVLKLLIQVLPYAILPVQTLSN